MEHFPNHELTDEEWEAPLDDETEAMITAAIANSHDFYDCEVAEKVRYTPSDDCLHLTMKSGRQVVVPVDELQDLSDADRSEVGRFTLICGGSALHWEQFDVGFRTEGLANGSYGNERWMKRLEEKRRAQASAALSQTA